MSSFKLKILAMAAMVVDHTAFAFMSYLPVPVYLVMRTAGRIAMPVFCFLIAEGFFHTRDAKKYLGRLFLFAVISEMPFDLLFHGSVLEFARGQNVFFTLFLGLAAITVFDKFAHEGRFAPGFGWAALCAAAALLLKTDYNAFGVLYIFAFYYFRGRRVMMPAAFAMLALCLTATHYIESLSIQSLISLGSLIAIPFLLRYDGARGPSVRGMKLSFYVFYPLHITILFLSVVYVGMALNLTY